MSIATFITCVITDRDRYFHVRSPSSFRREEEMAPGHYSLNWHERGCSLANKEDTGWPTLSLPGFQSQTIAMTDSGGDAGLHHLPFVVFITDINMGLLCSTYITITSLILSREQRKCKVHLLLGYFWAIITHKVGLAAVADAGPHREVKVIHSHHIGAALHALDIQGQPVLWWCPQLNLQRKKNHNYILLTPFFFSV